MTVSLLFPARKIPPGGIFVKEKNGTPGNEKNGRAKKTLLFRPAKPKMNAVECMFYRHKTRGVSKKTKKSEKRPKKAKKGKKKRKKAKKRAKKPVLEKKKQKNGRFSSFFKGTYREAESMDTAVDFREPDARSASFQAERTLFEIRPVLRAYSGLILLGLVLLPFFLIGVVVLFGVFYRVFSRKYRLTSQRLLMERGFLARQMDEVELYRLKDMTVSQGILQRLFGAGTVTVISTDDSHPRVLLRAIADPVAIKEQIRQAAGEARRREGVRTAEFIRS